MHTTFTIYDYYEYIDCIEMIDLIQSIVYNQYMITLRGSIFSMEDRIIKLVQFLCNINYINL